MGWVTLRIRLDLITTRGSENSAYANLLPLACITGLHDSHQVGMFSLLLGLDPSPSRAGYIYAIFGHDLETRDLGLDRLLGLLSRLFGNATGGANRWGADRPMERLAKGRGRRRRWGEHGGAEAGGLRIVCALLVGIWERNIVTSNECTGQEVDGGTVEEVDGDLGELVLLVGGPSDKGINQDLELLGAEGRLELERSTQERLGDGEGGEGAGAGAGGGGGVVCHCFQLQVAALLVVVVVVVV